MSKIAKLNDIEIYNEALVLTKQVYDLCKNPDLKREYALCDQVKRASISVAANIAEGFGRGSRADFSRFLSIALGSTNEMVALTDLIGLNLEKLDIADLRERYIVLSKRIYSFKRSLNI